MPPKYMTEDNLVDPSQVMVQNDGTEPMHGFQAVGYNQVGQGVHVPAEILSLLIRHQLPPRSGPIGNEFTARGSWTQQEDDQLMAAVQQLGTKKWTDIAKFVPTRTSKQCRERWHHRLNPTIKHEPFEPWEDQLIVEKQREIGNRWSAISKHLPGRSASAIKNRWYSGLKSQHPTHAQMDLNLGQLPPTPEHIPPPLEVGDDDQNNSELNQPSTDL